MRFTLLTLTLASVALASSQNSFQRRVKRDLVVETITETEVVTVTVTNYLPQETVMASGGSLENSTNSAPTYDNSTIGAFNQSMNATSEMPASATPVAPTASNSSTLQGDQTAPAMNMTDYGYGGMNMTYNDSNSTYSMNQTGYGPANGTDVVTSLNPFAASNDTQNSAYNPVDYNSTYSDNSTYYGNSTSYDNSTYSEMNSTSSDFGPSNTTAGVTSIQSPLSSMAANMTNPSLNSTGLTNATAPGNSSDVTSSSDNSSTNDDAAYQTYLTCSNTCYNTYLDSHSLSYPRDILEFEFGLRNYESRQRESKRENPNYNVTTSSFRFNDHEFILANLDPEAAQQVDAHLSSLPRHLPFGFRVKKEGGKNDEVNDDFFAPQQPQGRIGFTIARAQTLKKMVKKRVRGREGRVGVDESSNSVDGKEGRDGQEGSDSNKIVEQDEVETSVTSSTSRLGDELTRSSTTESFSQPVRSTTLFQQLLTRSKDLRHLLHRNNAAETVEDDEILVQVLNEMGLISNEPEEEIYVEVLYEHQRGAIVFGERKFSSELLTQIDPAQFTGIDLKNTPFTPKIHPLPTPFWRWIHPVWMVDHGGDVDEQGWSYSFRFRSTKWCGRPTWLSFVRRRRWIRSRRRVSRTLLPDPLQPKVIDWSALRNSAFADRETPNDGDRIDESIDNDEIDACKVATSLLPLSPQRKNDIFSWSAALSFDDPFLSWSFIKREGDRVLARRNERDAEGSRSDEELLGVWRDAIVVINSRRVSRVMGGCRSDREKLNLWQHWLGDDSIDEGDDEKRGKRRPDVDDVWPLIEMRLDTILQSFEFQYSRRSFLQLVLSLHPLRHGHHQYTSYDRGHPFEPSVLSPSRDGRFEFYSDVVALEKYFQGAVAVVE